MPQKILTLTSELQDVSPKLLFPILQTLEFSAGSIRAVHLLYFLRLKTYVTYLAALYLSETNKELKKLKIDFERIYFEVTFYFTRNIAILPIKILTPSKVKGTRYK